MPATLPEQEYMSLAKGVGCVPEKFRNLGFGKLDYEPGEGGIGTALSSQSTNTGPGTNEMRQFLAAIASGADSRELAATLLASDPTPSTGRKARKETV